MRQLLSRSQRRHQLRNYRRNHCRRSSFRSCRTARLGLSNRDGNIVIAPRFIGFAQVYAALGEIDKSFDWLEKAYQEHTGSLAIITVWPEYDSLRNDKRYLDLLKRIGLSGS